MSLVSLQAQGSGFGSTLNPINKQCRPWTVWASGKPALQLSASTTSADVHPCAVFLLCAGDMSPATAWVLVLALAVAGLGIVAANFGPLITKVRQEAIPVVGVLSYAAVMHLKRQRPTS